MYDQLSTIKQAALHGLGVALLPEYLVQRYIAAGRIAAAWGGPTPTPGPYCVVWSASKVKDGALTKFLNWLATQTGEDDLLP